MVGPVQIAPVASARDLGVYLDCDMTMKTHVTRLVHDELLFWHSSTDLQHPSIATALDVYDAHLQFRHVEA